MTDSPLLRWHDPAWQSQAHDWIHLEAGRNGFQITGPIEQPHVYHWSTVMRVPTNAGLLYFKATAVETIHEIALTERLAQWVPDSVPELVSIDVSQGWMLMRDGGTQLRASIRPVKDVRPWGAVIKDYARLQITLAGHIHEMLELGLPDHRLQALPSLYKRLLADQESLMTGREKGLTSDEFRQLQDLTQSFEQFCADLAAHGIPESINHGDFHDGNVLLKDGRITFFDWGDADVTHPFVSLRTWFVSMEMALDLDEYAPPTQEMSELLNVYLDQWVEFGTKEELLRAYLLSRPVASIVKTLAWQQSISRMNEPVRTEYAWIVPEVLREFMVYARKLDR